MFTTAINLSDLWPGDAMIVQRAADDSIDWLPHSRAWRERSSASPLPLAGALSIVCHEAAVPPAALQLLRDCGLRLPDDILPYRNFDHMCGIIAEQVQRGRRIGITYTSRSPLAPVEAHINRPDLVAHLNDKANLASALPAEAVPERDIVEICDLARVLERRRSELPLVLKACSSLASGGGCDVVICRWPDDIEPACGKLARAERVVVETYYEFTDTWCLHFALGERGVIYCGAAEQICDERGQYHGNWCTPDESPGKLAIEIASHAAQFGWARAYRGFMGVDVGRTADRRCFAFDLNFRNNGSTIQVLLRNSIARAWGTACTRICHGISFTGSFDAMLDQLRAFHSRRELVPLLAFDTAQLGTADAKPLCNFLVAGRDVPGANATMANMRSAGFDFDAA